jgi:DNA-binding MarR family transcriptional regulator
MSHVELTSEENRVVTFPDKAFLNERLTFRLDVLAGAAIDANDSIFVDTLGLTIRETRVLRLIDDFPGITFSEISWATGLERSLTSRTIRKLLALKFIVRESIGDDARRYKLSTTALGKQTRIRARYLSDSLEEVLTKVLTAAELKILKSTLDRLAAWVRSKDYEDLLAAKRATVRKPRARLSAR